MTTSPTQHGGQTLSDGKPAEVLATDLQGAADPWSFQDPFAPFAAWMRDAEAREVNDPNAMALATVDGAGLPDVRMVLLKGVDARGFVFYSNRESAKGRELAVQAGTGAGTGAGAGAALVLHWKSLRRQVRIRGRVEEVTERESDEYFASRPRGSRVAAWASQQSRPLDSRAALEGAVADATARFGDGEIPRPAYWIGWRVLAVQVEFWQDKPFRLHDRVQFARQAPEDGRWTRTRLFP